MTTERSTRQAARRCAQPLAGLLLAAACALASGAAQAQATIDQNKVLAGNVTPGDAPGFPLTISQSGSYKLMSNLYVPAGSTGVLVTAPNVTLDLNGFTIQGPNSCTRVDSTKVVSCSLDGTPSNSHGIDASDTQGLQVFNGTVKGFAGMAVWGSTGSRYDNLRLTESYVGLNDLGTSSIARHVIADLNRRSGISVSGGVVANCVSRYNGGKGFYGSAFTLLSESTAHNNGDIGVDGTSARGVNSRYNGTSNSTNFASTQSMGGNLNNGVPF